MNKIRNLVSIAFLLLAILFISGETLARDGTYLDISDKSVDAVKTADIPIVKAINVEYQFKFAAKTDLSEIVEIELPTQELHIYKFLYVGQIQHIPINDEKIFNRFIGNIRASPD